MADLQRSETRGDLVKRHQPGARSPKANDRGKVVQRHIPRAGPAHGCLIPHSSLDHGHPDSTPGNPFSISRGAIFDGCQIAFKVRLPF
jgi:hypothetical protein